MVDPARHQELPHVVAPSAASGRPGDATRIFYLFNGISTFCFTLTFTVNLIYMATVVGLSPLQMVLVGTVLEISAFVFEIPTGIVADLYSRRVSVIIGF